MNSINLDLFLMKKDEGFRVMAMKKKKKKQHEKGLLITGKLTGGDELQRGYMRTPLMDLLEKLSETM